MTDTFEFTLNNPLTEEQWDMITDVDFDRTDRITFHTKHGKEVEFTKVIRCKDCKHRVLIDMTWRCLYSDFIVPEHYCGYAERKE
jgi:hypothetical protein